MIRRLVLMLFAALALPAGATLHFAEGVPLTLPSAGPNFQLRAETAAVADANADGWPDVMVFASGCYRPDYCSTDEYERGHAYYLFLNSPSGFVTPPEYGTFVRDGVPRYSQQAATFADLDGDGRAEIVTADVSGGLDILSRNDGNGLTLLARLPLPLKVALMVRAADVDDDGRIDLLATSGSGPLAFYKGAGGLQFDAPRLILSYEGLGLASTGGVEFVDADGDGRLDLLSWSQSAIGLSMTTPDGPDPDPTWVEDAPWSSPRVAVGHFTAGGPPELLTVGGANADISGTQAARMRRVDGEYVVVGTQDLAFPPTTAASALLAADLDGDGLDELILGAGAPLVFSPRGDGNFDAPIWLSNPAGVGDGVPRIDALHVVDFNRDGCPDIGNTSAFYFVHYRSDCPPAAGRRPPAVRAAQRKPEPAARSR